ncbi:MAG: hypothetical protein NTY03_03330 [Candidatus Bathyarchaeota archaeon]|nr:hypothetical protein [Candidatus Bathyarchaeota archaeon]
MSSKQIDVIKLSPNEEKLLNTLVDKGIREIKPKKVDHTIEYESLQELTKEISEKEIKKLLKSLTLKGFMKEKTYDSALFCPICDSLQVYSKYNCPQCQSLSIHRVQLIEHSFCGYIGNRSEFEQEEGLTCTKCKTFIGDFAIAQDKNQPDKSKKIRVIGSSFTCDKCGSKFEKPSTTHNCDRCGASFTYKEANYEKLPSYELTEKVESLAPNRFIMDALRQVEKVFTSKGYQVELNSKLLGKSGVEQSFDLVAKKAQDAILLDVSAWGSQNDLINLLGKKMDVNFKSMILLDLAGNLNLASLGETYKITVLNGKDNSHLKLLAALLDEAEKEEPKKRGTGFMWRKKRE